MSRRKSKISKWKLYLERQRYGAGETSVDEIARHYGATTQTVKRWLSGVSPPVKPPVRGKRERRRLDRQLYRARYAAGEISIEDIMWCEKVTRRTVLLWLRGVRPSGLCSRMRFG